MERQRVSQREWRGERQRVSEMERRGGEREGERWRRGVEGQKG